MAKRIRVPNFKLLEDVVSQRILNAARIASKALDEAGIRHALIGGLAVGAYGYPRATKDVDFIIGAEGFSHHAGGLVTFKPGVPFEVNGVVIDKLADEVVIDQVDDPLETDGIPIVEPEALVYLKLKAFRRRDKEDVIELLRAGLDEEAIRDYLEERAPELIVRLDEMADLADEEE